MPPLPREDPEQPETQVPTQSLSLHEPLLLSQDGPNNSNSNSNSYRSDKDIHIQLPNCFGRTKEFSMNHNVLLNLILCVLYGISDSLWTGTVLAAYLKKLGHSQNRFVGNVEAASGMASLCSALPVGYLADTLGRSQVLKWGGGLLLVTAFLHACLLEWIGTKEDNLELEASSRHHEHVELYLALIMALWGVGGGVINGPAQALYADSTPKGNRSLYYVYLYNCYNVASCLGPLVSIGLFQTLGDEWDLYDLRIVIYVGLALEVVNGTLMMFFDDKKALDEEEDEDDEEEEDNDEDNEDENGNENQESTTVNDRPGPATGATSATSTNNDEEQPAASSSQQVQQQSSSSQPRYNKQHQAWIPYIIFVHSLVFALGSGMTVKFFPLFFKDQVGMSPSQVQTIYVIVPLVMAACSGLGQALSSRLFGGLGRVPTAILLMSVGVSGLYSMVICKEFLKGHPLLLITIYILRTSLINASYPLEESILMDFVPKKERARWKSLESIASFGWCGSAALGGWLSDHANGDYTFTFLITAIVQTIGIVIFALLWPLVPRLEGDDGHGGCNNNSANGNANANPEHCNNGSGEYGFTASAAAATQDTTLQAPLIPATEQLAALREPLLEVAHSHDTEDS